MLKQEELIKKVRTYNPFLDPKALTKAYTFALKAHKNQKRDSGDPYLIHPVAVADILSDLKLDSATITVEERYELIEALAVTPRLLDDVHCGEGNKVADCCTEDVKKAQEGKAEACV